MTVSLNQTRLARRKGFLNAKQRRCHAVMGVGVRHKLISGISISPNHSVRETTLFPEVFNQTLNHSLWEDPQEWLEKYHMRSLCLRRCFAFGNG